MRAASEREARPMGSAARERAAGASGSGKDAGPRVGSTRPGAEGRPSESKDGAPESDRLGAFRAATFAKDGTRTETGATATRPAPAAGAARNKTASQRRFMGSG